MTYSIPREADGSAVSHAWPGGYEVFYLADDGETLCWQCVNDPSNPVHDTGDADGWLIIGHSHTGETDSLETCAHCGRIICEDPAQDVTL